jgi:hypothetical protein
VLKRFYPLAALLLFSFHLMAKKEQKEEIIYEPTYLVGMFSGFSGDLISWKLFLQWPSI